MREILFRGKTKDEWVESRNINTQIDMYGKEHTYMGLYEVSKFAPLQKTIYWVEVISETVGQFTGLTDKNGKKIFEGDIVQGIIVSSWNKAPIKCKVVYKRDKFVCEEILRGARIADHKVCFAKDIEVVGNIHDNPELLKELQK